MNVILALVKDELRDLLDTSTDLIQIVDQQGIIQYVNEAWSTVLGYEEREVLFSGVSEYLDCEELESFLASGVRSGSRHFLQADVRKKGGRSHPSSEGSRIGF